MPPSVCGSTGADTTAPTIRSTTKRGKTHTAELGQTTGPVAPSNVAASASHTVELQPLTATRLTKNTATGHNCCMLRRVLLAASLCLAIWATVDRGARPPAGIDAAPSTVSCLTDAPGSTDGRDPRWHAATRTSASITESVWRSELHHAELAGAFCLDGCDAVRRTDRPQPHAQHTSWRLHDIPLLI